MRDLRSFSSLIMSFVIYLIKLYIHENNLLGRRMGEGIARESGRDMCTLLNLKWIPSNPTPRHIPWGNQNWKRHIYPIVHSALFTIPRMCKQPRCSSTDELIKKLWYMLTMEYYSAIKRNAFESVLMRWMNPEPIIQSEVSHKEKDKYHILTNIYGI